MFGNERMEIEKELIKNSYTNYKFIDKHGPDYYYEVNTIWNGPHIVRVSFGFFGISIVPHNI